MTVNQVSDDGRAWRGELKLASQLRLRVAKFGATPEDLLIGVCHLTGAAPVSPVLAAQAARARRWRGCCPASPALLGLPGSRERGQRDGKQAVKDAEEAAPSLAGPPGGTSGSR